MDQIKLPSIDAKKLQKLLERDFEDCVAEVTEAVNTAHTGAVIDESEELVRVAMAKLRKKVFQKALQMKMDAASAAFSPSQQSKRKK